MSLLRDLLTELRSKELSTVSMFTVPEIVDCTCKVVMLHEDCFIFRIDYEFNLLTIHHVNTGTCIASWANFEKREPYFLCCRDSISKEELEELLKLIEGPEE